MGRKLLTGEQKEASNYTKRVNRLFGKELGIKIEDAANSELELAQKQCILSAEGLELTGEDGTVIWSLKAYEFLKEKAVPDSVNPSLWLNGKCNLQAGVFSVMGKDILQVRGFDIANLTLVRSKTGWIVLDTTSCVETARASIQLVEKAIGESVHDRIRAVIVSHSHGDHFGGLRGVLSEEQVGPESEGKTPIFVPAGYEEACVKENVYAGTAMMRRSCYQFGGSLPAGEKGSVSVGLGLRLSNGAMSYLNPTDIIEKNETRIIDGLEVGFQLTPGTEAPAEMNNYFPEYRALWMAENCTGTLHNLYPIRGAKVRDAQGWAEYTCDALVKYGDQTEVVFQSHNWPHWNTKEHPETVKEYLRNTAAIYKYIHDQTLLYANQGFTPKEIARKIKVPERLARHWYIRPYYGSVEVNARAVFQRYLGYYNGNPVNLFSLTEQEEARKFVEYVGSEERVLEMAQRDFERGEYQYAAKAANQVVYSNPKNQQAKYLCADALEQLGYQAESGIWRNAYLTGAYELRNGVQKRSREVGKQDLTQKMTCRMILEYLGIVLDGEKASREEIQIQLTVTDTQEEFYIHLYHGALLFYQDFCMEGEKVVSVKMPKQGLLAVLGKQIGQIRSIVETTDFSVLERLQSYVVDLSLTSDFPMVEGK